MCGVTNAIVAVIIYMLLVKYTNEDKTPVSYMKGAAYSSSLEMFLLLSVFLAFYANKILFKNCI